jgi:thiol-disulfide isomerase/thioredoxin
MTKPTEILVGKPTGAMMEKPTKKTGMTETQSPKMEDNESGMQIPVWFSTPLTDNTTGNTFSIIDLKGKVVLVETMATWCPNCLKQQKEVKSLLEGMAGNDGLVMVALVVDINTLPEELKEYTVKNGFNWHYAIPSAEVIRELGQLYGEQFLNPPATPMFIIDKTGDFHPLPFGQKSAEQLKEALQPFLEG